MIRRLLETEAQWLPLASGGHFLAGHYAELAATVKRFLAGQTVADLLGAQEEQLEFIRHR